MEGLLGGGLPATLRKMRQANLRRPQSTSGGRRGCGVRESEGGEEERLEYLDSSLVEFVRGGVRLDHLHEGGSDLGLGLGALNVHLDAVEVAEAQMI